MKTLRKTIALITILATTSLFASDSHSPSHNEQEVNQPKTTLSEPEIKAKAKEALASLVAKNKIDKSWLKVAVTKMGKKTFGGKVEWAVVFNNKNIKDNKKETLYIFLDLNGDITGTNYTGN